jgi:hypothetical protein
VFSFSYETPASSSPIDVVSGNFTAYDYDGCSAFGDAAAGPS